MISRLFGRAIPLVPAVAYLLGAPYAAAVVINEIHYHPPTPHGKTLEFIELYNPTDREVSLAGWRFVEGLEFAFPESASIAPSDFVVVARERAVFVDSFNLSGAGVYGDFLGALDNGGEEIVLVDAFNAVVDAVRYDDVAPWPEGPDGDGTSLQRRCAIAPSHLAENWSGGPDDPMTPLAPNAAVVCPPPERPPPRVAINEIHYHPEGDRDADEEFIELFNPGDAPISLEGWKITDGVEFTFPAGAASTIEPRDYLVVCRNAEHARQRFGVDKVVGDFTGDLANGDERLALVDETGAVVDVVTYRDRGDWPPYADGIGRSLERISAAAPGDDPANWNSSLVDIGADFETLTAEGPLGDLFTQRLCLGVDGVGEFIVDNVVVEALDNPGVNLIENGDFEGGQGIWSFLGNAEPSRVEEGIGVGGTRGLRLISQDVCFGICDATNSACVTFRVPPGLDIAAGYRLSFAYRYITGSAEFYARLLGGGIEAHLENDTMSPGRANTRSRAVPPPYFSHRGRFPDEPTSADPVWLSTRVRLWPGDALESVTITYQVGDVETTLAMFDDGLHGDGLAGDGVYGVEMPPFEHDTEVYFRFSATSVDGDVATSPRLANVSGPAPEETWGYYVNDRQEPSPLPVYHVLLDGADPEDPTDINRLLNCATLEPAGFAYRGEIYPRVGLRFRGNTACFIKKRNLKFRFNRGRYFKGVRKLNLQGLWTDKALLREHLAWDFIRDIGLPSCATEFVRIHLNGEYHGLFLSLEHPDRRFLQRNGIDEDGFLYKAMQPPRTRPGDPPPIGVSRQSSVEAYADYWEEETREDGDFSDIAAFIEALHDDGLAAGGPTVPFMTATVKEEMLIGYQIAQVVLNNIDSFAKNHFLYQDTRDGRWGLLTWDMDLVMGMFFDPDVVDPRDGREVGTLNCCMLSPSFDLDPWFTTTVRGPGFPLLHWFVQFFFTAGQGFFQRAYLVRLWDVLQEKYTSEAYEPRLDMFVDFLGEEQQDDIDRWGRFPCDPRPDFADCVRPSDIVTQVEIVKEQINLHRGFLVNFMHLVHPTIPSHDTMKITELMFNPDGAGEELEFVEILNTSDRDIDISGWGLAGGILYTFPEKSLVGPDEVILVVRDLGRFGAAYPGLMEAVQVFGNYAGRLSNDGEAIRLVDAGPGFPATVDFLDYRDGYPWPDVRDGFSIELTSPGRRRDNDRPEFWVQSPARGGTPGNITTSFRRGDANGDGAVNLSDPIFALDYLFRGGRTPECLDAADINDDGRVNLSDPVFLLDHLFRGGAQPPAPFSVPGRDPTPDALRC